MLRQFLFLPCYVKRREISNIISICYFLKDVWLTNLRKYCALHPYPLIHSFIRLTSKLFLAWDCILCCLSSFLACILNMWSLLPFIRIGSCNSAGLGSLQGFICAVSSLKIIVSRVWSGLFFFFFLYFLGGGQGMQEGGWELRKADVWVWDRF